MNRYTVFQTACAVLALVMGVLVLIGTKAHSQEAPALKCAPSADMEDVLKKEYGETLVAGGILGPVGIMYITANNETHTFSVLIRRPDNLSCIAMAGDGWAVVEAAPKKGDGL